MTCDDYTMIHKVILFIEKKTNYGIGKLLGENNVLFKNEVFLQLGSVRPSVRTRQLGPFR